MEPALPLLQDGRFHNSPKKRAQVKAILLMTLLEKRLESLKTKKIGEKSKNLISLMPSTVILNRVEKV